MSAHLRDRQKDTRPETRARVILPTNILNGKRCARDNIASSLGVGIGQHKQRWDYFAQAVALHEASMKDSSSHGCGEAGPSVPVRLHLPPSDLDRDGNGMPS